MLSHCEAVARRHQAVICTAEAHINVDECGAPERVAGIKLLTVPTPDGKLTVELVDAPARSGSATSTTSSRGSSRSPRSTELGHAATRSPRPAALADFAHAHGMVLHVDGARLANAAAVPRAARCGR